MQTRRSFLKKLFVGAAVVAVTPAIIAELVKAEPPRSVMTTPRFTKDMSELWLDRADIRRILAENAVRDILAEEDARFIAACGAVC